MTEANTATEGAVEVVSTAWTPPAVVRLSAGSAEQGGRTSTDLLEAFS
jgi:hypothetical protein